jgi:hypothetical protein
MNKSLTIFLEIHGRDSPSDERISKESPGLQEKQKFNKIFRDFRNRHSGAPPLHPAAFSKRPIKHGTS